jgi:hypothetical protein
MKTVPNKMAKRGDHRKTIGYFEMETSDDDVPAINMSVAQSHII